MPALKSPDFDSISYAVLAMLIKARQRGAPSNITAADLPYIFPQCNADPNQVSVMFASSPDMILGEDQAKFREFQLFPAAMLLADRLQGKLWFTTVAANRLPGRGITYVTMKGIRIIFDPKVPVEPGPKIWTRDCQYYDIERDILSSGPCAMALRLDLWKSES